MTVVQMWWEDVQIQCEEDAMPNPNLEVDTLRDTKIPLKDGSGSMPALGFGTLIPDPVATRQAVEAALQVGFRQFDCSERYRNEAVVGEALREALRSTL